MAYQSNPEFWKNKRICVTGGAGFLGSFVQEGLKARGADNVFISHIDEYDLVNQQDIQRMLDDSQLTFSTSI
jgi:GDP-L-fucose synthase